MVNRSLTFFGQRCRQLRIERGLSITDAAAKIGITRGYLSKLENGHKEPCLLTLIEIARGLRYTVRRVVRRVAGEARCDVP